MLYLVGLGLTDGKDITVRGREIVQSAAAVFLEGYTSVLQCTHDELESELGVPVRVLSREDVERSPGRLLDRAADEDIVLLVIGDPFGATTHADLVLRARERDVPVRTVHNASILTAIGELGLELYRYGRTVSIPFWKPGFEPVSFLGYLRENLSRGLHTLCLLDIETDEDRFMTMEEGIAHIRKAEGKTGERVLPELVVGVARLGAPDQEVVVGAPDDIGGLGGPPHCLIVPGRLHPIEEEMLDTTNKE